MIKSELIARLAAKFPHMAVRTAHGSVNHLIQMMADAMAERQRIEIRGFGSFSTKHRAARVAHNPKTGGKILTAEKYSPHFKPGKELREMVNSVQKNVEIDN